MLGFNDDIVRGKKKGKAIDASVNTGSWEIFVRRPNNGSRFPISVIPGNKIKNIKMKIKEKKSIPLEDQRLSFNNVPLKETKTVVGSGIKNGDTIDLGPMIIYVRTRNGKKFTFEVDHDDLIESIKKLVERREGTPAEKQRLYFNNLELEDGKSLSDYTVRHKSILDLGMMMIYVKPGGEKPKIELDVDPTDTLKSVKLQLKKHLRVPVSDQRLSFEETEMRSNSKDLQSYNVHHLDTLFMLEEGSETDTKGDDNNKSKMIIFVIKEWDSRKFKLRTELTDTILDVKKMIEASENIPVDQQRLTFKKKSVYNAKTLLESKVKNKSILYLGASKKLREIKTPPLSVEEDPTRDTAKYPDAVDILLPDMSTVTIPIQPSTKFSDIKDHIEKTNGIPKTKQRIFFLDNDDNEVDDNSHLPKLNSDGFKPIILRVRPDPDNVEVKTPDNRSFFFDFDPDSDTMKDLKNKIAASIGLPVNGLHLIDPSGDMVDENNDKMPSRGEILHVAPEVDVMLPDKSKVKVPLLPKMNINDVKDFIEEMTGTPKTKQRIFFFDSEGNELDDTKPLEKAGIEPDSVLEMRYLPPEEEKITVRMPDGRSFFFDFDPDADLKDDVKKKISKKFGVPIRNLPPLRLNDVELDDIDNYHPSKGDILDFVTTEIEVELPNSKRIVLTTLPIHTIGEIKDMVEEKTGFKRPDQRIFFFDSINEEIGDDKILANAKIKSGVPLKIFSPTEKEAPKEIKIIDPSGRAFHLIIDPNESVEDIKNKIRKKVGIPISGFKLNDKAWGDSDANSGGDYTGLRTGCTLEIDPPEIEVALPNSTKIKLKILPTMTIRDVKKLIEEQVPELSTSNGNQRMFFSDNSQELDDDEPFEKLDFDLGQTLEMRSMSIVVQDEDGRSYNVDVESDWYIDDVRDLIRQLTNIPLDQQLYTLHGKSVKEDLILIQQGIFHGSTLVIAPMSIYINIPSRKKPVRFTVKCTDTVDATKRKAMKKIKKKEKTKSSRNYCLVIYGKELTKNKTLEQNNVQHEDILSLEKFRISVIHWSGDTFQLDGVNYDTKIASIKKRIHKKEGIPINVLRLSVGGKRLEDHVTLDEEKIKHGTTLVLDPPEVVIETVKAKKRKLKNMKMKKLQPKEKYDEIMPAMPDWKKRIFFLDFENEFDAHIELVVMLSTGVKFTLKNILLKQKVKEIKTLVYELKGIKTKNQRISFNGTILENQKSLLEHNVGHRSILVLEPPNRNNISRPSIERMNRIFSTVPTNLVTSLNIKVKHWNGDIFHLNPAPNDYIDDVKDLIHDLKRIPIEYIRLTFKDLPTQDDINLKDQGIVDGSTLILVPMKIFLQLPMTSELTCLTVEINQTIHDVKKHVSKISKISFESLCIIFDGVELLDNSKTLFDLRVQHEDQFRVEIFRISIMKSSGAQFSVDSVNPNDTTYDLKTMISEQESIPIEKQQLILRGQPLNDVLKLKDQAVHHKAILVLDSSKRQNLAPVKEKVSLSIFKKKR